MKPVLKSLSIGAALMIALAACNKDELPSPSASGDPGNAGTFKVRMTDSPADYAALDVEITGVQAYLDGSGWVSLNNQAQFVNVLSLQNGVQTTLAFDADAEEGHYSRLKIIFGDENNLTLNAGGDASLIALNGSSEFDLNLVGGEHEIILDIDQNISTESGANILLDFNVASSIIQMNTGFTLDPEIEIVAHEGTGIRGDIHGVISAVVETKNGADEFSAYADANGNFILQGLDDGTYSITITGLEDNMGIVTEKEITLDGVIVAEGQITNMGAIGF